MSSERRRESAASILLLLMIFSFVGHAVQPEIPLVLSGAAGWGAAALLMHRLGRAPRIQMALLAGVGLAASVYAFALGGGVQPGDLIAGNAAIIAMLAGVSFLRLFNPAGASEPGPRGPGAFIRTAVGLNLFGAVINLPAMLLVGDRLARGSRLRFPQALMLCRTFSPAVMYSPFIGGMALALHLVPDARLPVVMLIGVPLAASAIGLAFLAAWVRDPDRLRDFEGYPLRLETVWVPVVLAAGVVIVHVLRPDVSVLAVIAGVTPVFVAAALLLRDGAASTVLSLRRHVADALPAMAGELGLFLAAGVLAIGLEAAFAAAGWQPFDVLDPWNGFVVVLVSIAVAMVGVHPIVTVSAIAPSILALAPDPYLFVITLVLSWQLGCIVSPYSGQVLMLQARYGANAWSFPLANAPYAVVVAAVGALTMGLYEALR